MQKRLAYALLNRLAQPRVPGRKCRRGLLPAADEQQGRRSAEPGRQGGVTNDANSTDGLWIPDWNWYIDNEAEITEISNEIFSG